MNWHMLDKLKFVWLVAHVIIMYVFLIAFFVTLNWLFLCIVPFREAQVAYLLIWGVLAWGLIGKILFAWGE